MPSRLDVSKLRQAVVARRIEWRRHALERMVERGIRRADVLTVLTSGEQIEEYPGSQPFPSGLFLGWRGLRPLHVVAALDREEILAYVITAYEPDLEHFEPGFRVRRKP